MNTRIVIGLLIALVASTATGDDATKPTWVDGLPIIKGTKSEVGFWNYIWGSALILAAPKKFGDYWPDYGYRWSNSAYLELCGWLGHDEPAPDAYLGRVRMVAATPQDAERLIGVELELEEHIKATLAADESPRPPANSKPGLSLNQLCELFDDDVARTYTETVVRAMAADPADILSSGTWKSDQATFEVVRRAMDYDYMLMWKGLGLDIAAAGDHGVKWTLDPAHEVVWEQPKHVQLSAAQKLLEEAGFVPGAKVVAGIDMGEKHQMAGYMLTMMEASWGAQKASWEAQKSMPDITFKVTDGAVDHSGFYAAASLEAAELTNTTFGVWTSILGFAELMARKHVPVWLVTENAIRHESLSPEIRVGDDG